MVIFINFGISNKVAVHNDKSGLFIFIEQELIASLDQCYSFKSKKVDFAETGALI